jgi:hypothetical protein
MIELLKSGKGRTIYNPEKADKLFARDIRRAENVWIEEQLAKNESIPGEVRERIPDHQTRIIDEIGTQGLIEEGRLDQALKEISDFFSEASGTKPTTKTKSGTLPQGRSAPQGRGMLMKGKE